MLYTINTHPFMVKLVGITAIIVAVTAIVLLVLAGTSDGALETAWGSPLGGGI